IVIEALHHEHDILRMGGLRRELPVAFWTFLVGGCALAGLPFTSGAFSKDLIVWNAWSTLSGSRTLWAASICGVLLTSFYTFRLVFVVFFGETKPEVTRRPGLAMQLPVWILAALAIAGGALREFVTRFASTILPVTREVARGVMTEAKSTLIAGIAFLAGLII